VIKKTVTCNVEITQCEDRTIKCEDLVTWYSKLHTSESHIPKKRRGMVELPDNRTIKCEKKNRVPLNVTKVQLDMILVLPNVTMEPSNVRKKKKNPLNVTKEQLHVILELHNVRIEPSNMRKNKRTTECNKSTITYNIGTT